MVGQTLDGRYKIIRKIGEGGFGITFLAEDIKRPGNPKCVVKQFQPMRTDPLTLQVGKILFDREAKNLEELGNHDQIPRLLAHFEENQQFYLVQEFIEGHDLTKEVYPGKKLSEAEIIQLLTDILEVVAFIHKQDRIHRDLKPSNIMRRKSDGKIVLIDFGAVKQVAGVEGNQHGYTAVTRHIGTPGYMPSEQTQGNPRFCSDIYAVGMIAIQGLTGLRRHHITSDAKTEEINWQGHVKVNSKLANVINKMVRYDFRQRYQSGEEALQAVKGLMPTSPAISTSLQWKLLLGVVFATALISAGIIFYILNYISKNSVTDYLVHKNDKYGIQIKYPEKGWRRQDKTDFRGEVANFFPTNKTKLSSCLTNVFINVNDFQEGKIFSLDEYKNFALKKIRNINPNTKITDSSTSKTTLSNFRAYKLVYTRQDGECSLRVMEIGTIRGGKAYFITYTAEEKQYSKLLPTVERMINSFKIVESN
ncbi:MAG: protein kinase [Mastigocoleus sp. MO_167.B18]|nr:protein kinase [Mastigocoleus sp. MO_167.B18]